MTGKCVAVSRSNAALAPSVSRDDEREASTSCASLFRVPEFKLRNDMISPEEPPGPCEEHILL